MKTVISVCLAVFCLVFMPPDGVCGARIPVDGVLRVNAKNPRYFTDNKGRAVYLTGSHTWSA